jgi:ADP-L-glycero-D-manno-heptose 6-epimerase
MASMVYHSFNQIKETGKVQLFKSHKYEYKDGGQLRDFIYVKDVVEVIFWMINNMFDSNWDSDKNGLYNVGTETKSMYEMASKTKSVSKTFTPEHVPKNQSMNVNKMKNII